MVILIQLLTTTLTLLFTLKCLKRYLPKLLAYNRDIFTVFFSFFPSVSKFSSLFRQSNNTSNADKSCNQDDTCISNHNRLQPLIFFARRQYFSQTNTM